jgi:predicted nucleotidyltransferase
VLTTAPAIADGESVPAVPRALHISVARLVRAFAPDRIVLFGSYARGTQQARSDIDLLVVAALAPGESRPLRRAHQLVATSFPPVDVVFCTPEELADADRARSPFLQSILESGVVLYRRPG